MCGISGIWSINPNSKNLLREVEEMAQIMKARGPNNFGTWFDENENIALSHARLSIIDLSESGNQPMISQSERYVMVFNGEIYNHKDLRNFIEKKTNFRKYWQGKSDSETLLAMIDIVGVKKTLDQIVGMFAFGVWDKYKKKLTLVRDRFGEKPLYWGWDNLNTRNSFFFASDIAAFKALNTNFSINQRSLSEYLKKGYVPAPYSIFNEINQLLPGQLVEINFSNKNYFDIKEYQWWDTFNQINNSRFKFSDEIEAITSLEEQLIKTINNQSISDVPLGVFLSGGIDSTLITALLQLQNKNPITTFTVAFPELTSDLKGYNEGDYAKRIANLIGTNHSEIELSTKETIEIITKLPKVYSEPFADSSQIPAYLVCREAKKSGINVALSGDGGDELFGGYNRHVFAPLLQKNFSKLPKYLRNISSNLILNFPSKLTSLSAEKLEKICFILRESETLESVYEVLTNNWSDLTKILNKNSYLSDDFLLRQAPSFEEKIMLEDLLSFLPNDILVKMDRASMASSFESRAPYLDHRVARIAWSMPINMKIKIVDSKRIGKWPLRKILEKYVPNKLIDRPKSGFAVPIGNWLKSDKNLNDWANDLLDENKIKKQGFLNHNEVKNTWKNFLSGKERSNTKVWTLLMWQAWLNEWFNNHH